MTDCFEFQRKVYNLPKDIHFVLRDFGVVQHFKGDANAHLLSIGKINHSKYQNINEHIEDRNNNTVVHNGNVEYSNNDIVIRKKCYGDCYMVSYSNLRRTVFGLDGITIYDDGAVCYNTGAQVNYINNKLYLKSSWNSYFG